MRSLLAVTIGLVSTASAFGTTLTVSDTVPIQSTNYSSSVSIQQFDPSLGVLNSILFHLEGTVQGGAKFESLDAAPATITMNLQSSITLQRPDTSILAVVLPLVQTVDNATAYDNTFDFGGTSGKTYTGLTNTAFTNAVSPPPLSDLALFTGLGNIVLPVIANGTSNGSGAGNLILQFNTSAGAYVEVTYDYTVPEPSALGLLSFGALMLRRRRA
jgi:hypothetical protein